MRLRITAAILTAATFVLSFAPSAHAGGLSWFARKGKPAAKADFADFRGKAHLRIPPGYRYFFGDELAAFNKDSDNPTDPDEVGVFVPESGDWAVFVFVPSDDVLGGVAKEDVAGHAEQLLAHLRAKTAAENRNRVAAGMLPLRITGWTHKPAFDKDANRVTWGYRLTDDDDGDDEDTVNYETILFGPDGEVVELMTVADLKNYARPIVETKKLADAVVFGPAPGLGRFNLSGLFDNETGLFIGAGVMALVVGGGLVLRQAVPQKKRTVVPPRGW